MVHTKLRIQVYIVGRSSNSIIRALNSQDLWCIPTWYCRHQTTDQAPLFATSLFLLALLLLLFVFHVYVSIFAFVWKASLLLNDKARFEPALFLLYLSLCRLPLYFFFYKTKSTPMSFLRVWDSWYVKNIQKTATAQSIIQNQKKRKMTVGFWIWKLLMILFKPGKDWSSTEVKPDSKNITYDKGYIW